METKLKLQHTPTPWKALDFDEDTTIIYDKDMRVVIPKLANKENATFIVRAVNSHEELLAATKRALDGVQRDIAANPTAKTDRPEIEAMLRYAIAKAEGK